MNRLNALLPIPYTGRGIGYTCVSLLSVMAKDASAVSLTTPYATRTLPVPVQLRQALPRSLGRAAFRYARGPAMRWTEGLFLSRARKSGSGAVSYIWSDTSEGFSEALGRSGGFVVREKVNCGKALAKRVLDDAYARLGLPPAHGITDAAIEEERRRLQSADAIFCPSPFVEESLEEIGVPAPRRLSTSYGFNPSRLDTAERMLAPVDGPTFVFVGTICVRKGAHLILEAFARSGIKGRLVFAGALEPTIERLCAKHLARPDVVRLDYVPNVAALYRSADVFVFPTLEEGSPLVSYEAAYCGLPSILSPMGAGRVVRDGLEGLVVDPYDVDGWIDALRHFANDESERRRMGAAAHARSLDYTWVRVGAERTRLLERAVA